jgi:hypothetical protein
MNNIPIEQMTPDDWRELFSTLFINYEKWNESYCPCGNVIGRDAHSGLCAECTAELRKPKGRKKAHHKNRTYIQAMEFAKFHEKNDKQELNNLINEVRSERRTERV